MMLRLIFALAAAEPASVSQVVLDAKFAPLGKREQSYRQLGPAGPYYPAAAAQRGVNGEAVLECKAAAHGRLKSCKVVSEEPKRRDFGPAARVMAGSGRVLISNDAAAPGVIIRVRVPFVLGAPAEVEP